MKTILALHFAIIALFLITPNHLIAQKKSSTTKSSKSSKTDKKVKIAYQKYIKSAKEIEPIYNRFERLQYELIGHFSNKEQVADGTTTEPLQEFIVMPIFQDRPGEFWVYLEFFSPEILNAPLDQRIEQYVQIARDTFRMEVYYLKNPKKYINAWRMEEFPKTNIREDLTRGEGCDLIIAYQEDGSFKTVPPKEITCEMLTAQGASRYVDLAFEITPYQYLMWFHFYNVQKEHLKKSAKDGLIFRRLEGRESNHLLNF